MWPLLRKNLWLWRPPHSANPTIFSLALLFGVADAIWTFPHGAWIAGILLSLLLAQASGTAMNGVDTRDNSMEFLAYLPVRRSSIWLANWFEGALSFILLIALMFGYRTLAPLDPNSGYAELIEPIGSKWLPPVLLFLTLMSVFSYSAFWRLFLKGDMTALLVTNFAAVIFLWTPWIMLTAIHLSPAVVDLGIAISLVGGAFALAGFVGFAIPPPYWPRWERVLALGLPLTVMLVALHGVLFLVAVHRWNRLDWSEPQLSFDARVLDEPQPLIIGYVNSERSGRHAVYLEPETDRAIYLGRGVHARQGIITPAGQRRILIDSSLNSSGHLPIPYQAEIEPISGERRKLDARIFGDDGRENIYRSTRWTDSGEFAIITSYQISADRRSRPQRTLTIVDRHARVLREFATNSEAIWAYRLVSGERLVTFRVEDRDRAPQFFVLDLKANELRPLSLPGRVLALAQDLSRAVVLCSETREGIQERWIVSIDLDSGEASTIIGRDGIDPVDTQSQPSYMSEIPQEWLPAENQQLLQEEPAVQMAFDRDCRQAMRLVARWEQNTLRQSLVHIDLLSGEHRIVVPETQLIRRASNRWHPGDAGIEMHRFTADGRAFAYSYNNDLHWVGVADGSSSAVALPSAEYPALRFSPNGRRALRAYSRPKGDPWVDDPPHEHEYIIELVEPEGMRLLHSGPHKSAEWFDDQRLVTSDNQGIFLLHLEDGSAQCLLSKEKRAIAAGSR